MQLHHEIHGSGPPLIILHGLLGSGDNWRTMARWLAGRYRVFSLDLRNHGRSPHCDRMDYPAMAEDLRQFMEQHSLGRTILLGHSMGGKVAMRFALAWPEMVEKLVVVDIAPKPYGARHDDILRGLVALEPERFREREDIDLVLQASIPDPDMRLFLLKNLVRTPRGSFAWRINLESIVRNYDVISGWPVDVASCGVSALFMKGECSDYLRVADAGLVRDSFPRARLVTISHAGHWPHVEAPGVFRAALDGFLAAA
ncbi:alpha/beta fold hydrolase [Pelobacter propionicus]|nr:alpha/beta fold hydrolase [Pelobacter propionicus]